MSRTVHVAIGPDDDIAETVGRVRAEAGSRAPRTLEIALLPPVAQLRFVTLPPMPEDDARKVVARNVSRYFPDVAEAQTIAVTRTAAGWLVAAAPAAVVAALHAAAAAHGFGIGTMVPAPVLWARAARDGKIAVEGSRQTTVLDVRRGSIRGVRRLRPRAPLPPELAAARTVARDDGEAARLSTREGWRAVPLELVPDDVRARRARTVKRAAWWLADASAALLMLGAGLILWGEHRELNAVRAHRAAIRAQVQGALAGRDTLLDLTEHVSTIAGLQRSTHEWSSVIALVAGALPLDASLTAFHGEADSIALEGQAAEAAGVFAAMRAAPGIAAVRASAPVRQEGGGPDGQPVIERFVVAANLGRTRESP